MGKDEHTISYFDENVPEYGDYRADAAIDFINKYYTDGQSLIDIGCGTGNILALFKNKTKIQHFIGLDVSQNCLIKTQERVACDVHVGSIFDDMLPGKISRRFDFAVMGAVLHHLVGKTRKESKRYAMAAIYNALRLLKADGYLIIYEPVFYPSGLMDILFYVKKSLVKVTSKRVNLFGVWNNIGAPVVSYYTNEQLLEMINDAGDCKMVEIKMEETPLPLLWRLAGITRRVDTTILVKKAPL